MPRHQVVFIDSAQDVVALLDEHRPDGGCGGGGTEKIDIPTAPRRAQARTDHDSAAESNTVPRECCEAAGRERGRARAVAQDACERGEERGLHDALRQDRTPVARPVAIANQHSSGIVPKSSVAIFGGITGFAVPLQTIALGRLVRSE